MNFDSQQEIKNDPVNHPKHYIWRAGEKRNKLEDLQKARWYLDREISRLTKDLK